MSASAAANGGPYATTDSPRNRSSSTPPTAVILSPGPGHPQETGVCQPLIRQAAGRLPSSASVLGHQAIVTAYGGIVGRAGQPMHGPLRRHPPPRRPPLRRIPRTAPAARYHSLCAEKLPAALRPIATSDEGDIMAVRHTAHPVWGVQFHPESILTPDGSPSSKLPRTSGSIQRQTCTG